MKEQGTRISKRFAEMELECKYRCKKSKKEKKKKFIKQARVK